MIGRRTPSPIRVRRSWYRATFGNAVLDDFLFFLHKGDKAVDEVEQAVTLQHFLPEVACGIAIGILGIACTASHTSTIGALVERQEVSFSIRQLVVIHAS